jgi:hypothetical protein
MAIFLFYLSFDLLFVWQIESLPILADGRDGVELMRPKETCSIYIKTKIF